MIYSKKYGQICMNCGKTVSMTNKDGECNTCVTKQAKRDKAYMKKQRNYVLNKFKLKRLGEI